MTQKTRKLISSVLTLLLVAALALGLSACSKDTSSKPSDGSAAASETDKKISVTVEIVDDKGEKTVLDLETGKTTLADALVEEGIVEYAADGLYTTVNGITADYSKDGAWWCVTKGGIMTTEGMNTLKLSDGDSFEITYTK